MLAVGVRMKRKQSEREEERESEVKERERRNTVKAKVDLSQKPHALTSLAVNNSPRSTEHLCVARPPFAGNAREDPDAAFSFSSFSRFLGKTTHRLQYEPSLADTRALLYTRLERCQLSVRVVLFSRVVDPSRRLALVAVLSPVPPSPDSLDAPSTTE